MQTNQKKPNQQYQVDLQKLNINNAHALLYSAVTLSFFSLKINVKKNNLKLCQLQLSCLIKMFIQREFPTLRPYKHWQKMTPTDHTSTLLEILGGSLPTTKHSGGRYLKKKTGAMLIFMNFSKPNYTVWTFKVHSIAQQLFK